MNACIEQKFERAIDLLFIVIARALCDVIEPQFDQAGTAIFASALALARSGINPGNLGAAGHA
jgi:hypothetical protein